MADNLAAHGLGGFRESFRATYFCRFCFATQTETQISDAMTGGFETRRNDSHDTLVQEMQTNETMENYGVKQSCVLSNHLSYFHPITGFPPDCGTGTLKGLVAKKYFTLEELNKSILCFPF